MVAEAAHSWSDAGNEVFLLVAERRAAKPADASHPSGTGGRPTSGRCSPPSASSRRAPSCRSGTASRAGVRREGEEVDYTWAYAVLALAFVLEGVSFLQARRQTRSAARIAGLHPLRYLARTSNPTLRAVYAEDAAALVGILLAASGIGLHQATGDARWDAAGSVLVGRAARLRGRLPDQSQPGLPRRPGRLGADACRRGVQVLHDDPEVERVTFLHLEFVGPGKVFLVAAVDLTGDATEGLRGPSPARDHRPDRAARARRTRPSSRCRCPRTRPFRDRRPEASPDCSAGTGPRAGLTQQATVRPTRSRRSRWWRGWSRDRRRRSAGADRAGGDAGAGADLGVVGQRDRRGGAARPSAARRARRGPRTVPRS